MSIYLPKQKSGGDVMMGNVYISGTNVCLPLLLSSFFLSTHSKSDDIQGTPPPLVAASVYLASANIKQTS